MPNQYEVAFLFNSQTTDPLRLNSVQNAKSIEAFLYSWVNATNSNLLGNRILTLNPAADAGATVEIWAADIGNVSSAPSRSPQTLTAATVVLTCSASLQKVGLTWFQSPQTTVSLNVGPNQFVAGSIPSGGALDYTYLINGIQTAVGWNPILTITLPNPLPANVQIHVALYLTMTITSGTSTTTYYLFKDPEMETRGDGPMAQSELAAAATV
jgi:hypothetical protein